MRRSSRPEPIRAVQEVQLVDRLQQHDNRPLENLILQGGNSDGASFRTGTTLRNVHPSYRRSAVRAGLRAVEQVLEVTLQILFVFGRGHAIHAHDLLCHVLGPVEEVFAMADTRVNTIETEDCAALSFRMKSGALATSSVTLGAAEDTSRLRFCFEGFTAESGTLPYRPAEDTWRFIARAPTTQDQIDAVLAKVADGENGFAGFVEAIADAMEGRGGKEVTVNDGLQSIELVTAIYRSVRERKPVRLSDAAEGEWIKGWAPRASANA